MSIGEGLPQSQLLQLTENLVKDVFYLLEDEEGDYSHFWLAFYSDLSAAIKQEYWKRRL